MSDKELKVLLTGDASGLFKALGDASLAVKSMATEMEATVGGLKTVFTNLMAPLAILGGIEFFKKTVDETKDWTVEAQRLARTLGITTEQASILNVAIADIHGNSDEYLAAAAKLIKTLNTNEEAFHKLGVATRDQNGRLRDAPVLMAEVNQRLSELKAGTDRGVAASQIYGKSWKDVLLYLNMTPEVMEEARAKAERLNLIVGGDAVAATEAYRHSMNELDDTVKALKIRIGQELMPVMTDFNNSISKEAPDALTSLGIIINLVVTAIKTVTFAINAVIQTIITLGMTVGKTLGAVSDGVGWAITGNFTKAKNAIKEGMADADREFAAGNAVIQKDFEQLGRSLNLLWDPSLRPQAKSSKVDAGTGAAHTTGDSEKEFEKLKASLEKKRELFENAKAAQGEFIEWSKAQDAAYWRNVLATQDLAEKTRIKAQQEFYKARREVLKKGMEESKQLEANYRERDKADALGELTAQQVMVDRYAKLGLITEQQALTESIHIAEAKYQVDLKFLQAGLAAKNLEPLERAKINGQIEALERQHSSNMTELQFKQADLDRQKDGWAGWAEGIREALLQAQNSFQIFKQAATQILGGIEGALANSLASLTQHGQTAAQKWNALWMGISGAVVNAVAKMGAQWLVAQAAQAAFGVASTTQAVAIAEAETSASLAAGAAGAWEAYGWMPYIGAELAMAQIEAMEISVAAAGAAGVVGAAEGGWFDRPTLTVMGEGSQRELAVPEVSFKDWAGNLAANIMGRQDAINGYGRLSYQMASQFHAQSGGGGAGLGALAGGGYVDLRGAVIAGESVESARIIGNLVSKHLDAFNKRRG